MFELIRDLGLDVDYLGIDVTEKFLEVAQEPLSRGSPSVSADVAL